MNFNAKDFYLWLVSAGLWRIILYRRYRKLPQKLLGTLSKLGFNPQNECVPLSLKDYEHPIWARYQSSDVDVFYQIFIEREYSCLDDVEDAKLIIDCGANVGYSSLYFLKKYPNAYVIAVEPDEENFKICQKNLLPYKDRVLLINSAIWSHEAGLVVCKGVDVYGEGCEWATYVQECQGEQKPDLLATDISSLLNRSGFKTIDILKIDIEGAENVIFSKNYRSWLNQVKNIVIELHGEACQETFFHALSNYQYDLSSLGELTVCKSIEPKAVAVS